MNNSVLLTPGFSPVLAGRKYQNRFNGFSCTDKPLKRLVHRNGFSIRLKPGANENIFANFEN